MKARAIVLGLAGGGLGVLVSGPSWARALAWVALAGTGVLLVVDGPVRRVLGGVLIGVGLGLGAGGYALPGWKPFAVAATGLLIVACGFLAARTRTGWSSGVDRYQRPSTPAQARTSKDIWDALDRGEDPTTGS